MRGVWILAVLSTVACSDAPSEDEGALETTEDGSTTAPLPSSTSGSGPTGSGPGTNTTTPATTAGPATSAEGTDSSTGEPPPPPAECGDSALFDVVNQLEPGQWATLDTVGLTDDLIDAGNGHHITQYTFKGVFDPTWCRVLFTGGGHISYVKFVSYDIASNTWQREVDPSWWCDPFDVPENPWPCVGHAYGHNAIDVEGGRYFYKHGAVYEVGVEGVFGSEWTALPDHGANVPFTSLAYFPELGGLVMIDYSTNGVLVLYDGAGAWESVSGPFAMGAYHIYGDYNPVESVVMFGSGNGSQDWHVLRSDATVQTVATSPRFFHPSPSDPATFRILTHDPQGGDFLAIAPNGDTFGFDLDTNTWSDTGVVLPQNLEFAVPIPDYGVVLLVNGRGNEVVVYNHGG